MTDEQIRQAFENRYDTRETWGDRDAWDQSLLDFESGYKAALASLEKTCWLKANGDAVYLDKPDEVFQYEPLYRIKEKS